jgi:hypothetical protein
LTVVTDDDAEALRLVAVVDAKLRRTNAEQRYRRIGDASQLLALGIAPATVKRGRGHPSKTMFDDRQIVQLIWRQKLQAGESFSNSEGKENNPCIVAVARAQGRHVSAVIRQWTNVPAAERQSIEEWLRAELAKRGLLHDRHKK